MQHPFYRIYSLFTIFIFFSSGIIWTVAFWSQFGNQNMFMIFSENSLYDIFKFFVLSILYPSIIFYLVIMIMASVYTKDGNEKKINVWVFYELFKSLSITKKILIWMFVGFLIISSQVGQLIILFGVVFSAMLYPVILNLDVFKVIKSNTLRFIIANSIIIFPFYCFALAYVAADVVFKNNSMYVEEVENEDNPQKPYKFIGIIGKNQYALSQSNTYLIIEDIFSGETKKRPVTKISWKDKFLGKHKTASD
jgi:hypothetical protein